MGIPNTVHMYLIKNTNRVISSYVYDEMGYLRLQVDFDDHGAAWKSGHSHFASKKGDLGSAHAPENHISHDKTVPEFLQTGNNVPKLPIGASTPSSNGKN